MIIAVTGMPLAGKGVVSTKLEEKGYPRLIMSSVVKEEMKKRNIEVNYENILEFASSIRTEKGNCAVAWLCLPYLDDLLKDNKVVILDGVRSPEAIEMLKKQYGEDFVLVAVTASFEKRLKRLGREDHAGIEASNEEEMRNRDNKEISMGLADTMDLADHMITNDGSFEDFELKIQELFNELGV